MVKFAKLRSQSEMTLMISASTMIAFLCAIAVFLIFNNSACDAAGGSRIDFHHLSNLNSHHMHTMMMKARRLPTTMAFQFQRHATTTIYAGTQFQQHSTADVASPRRRRRRIKRNFIGVMAMDKSDATTKVTQYTINDSVCPPTDPDTLEKIVLKHIHALPRYWFSRPVANHTAEAFQEALGKFCFVGA